MKKLTRFLLLVLCLACLLCCACGQGSQKTKDLNRLSAETYSAFFLSMFSVANYSEEDFLTYRGLQSLVLSSAPSSLTDMVSYLDAACLSENKIEEIYLGLDPMTLWHTCQKKESVWQEETDALLASMDAHPDILFDILLSHPDMTYWTGLPEDELSEAIERYRLLGMALLTRENARLHFNGSERWLICNPANYEDSFSCVNASVSRRLLLLNFCGMVYQMDSELLENRLTQLSLFVVQEKSTPATYPDCSSCYFVFLGDSIMAYDLSTASIPGVVCGLSGARGSSLSQGGTAASSGSKTFLHLETMIDAMIHPEPENFDSDTAFYAGLLQYKNDLKSGVVDGRHLYIVLCLGVNDYFNGFPVENPADPFDISTYSGALRSGITRLKAQYPDAEILVMTPAFCTIFENGTEKLDPKGGVLTDYVDAALEVCRELQVTCANVYADSGINDQTAVAYLVPDGVHPSESGRFLLGNYLLNVIAQN